MRYAGAGWDEFDRKLNRLEFWLSRLPLLISLLGMSSLLPKMT